MKEKEFAYKVIKNIPFSTINVNSIIKKIGNEYIYNGMVIPFFNDKIASYYCVPVEIHIRYIENEKLVLFLNSSNQELENGKIVDFDEFSGKYKVQYKVSKIRSNSKWLDIKDIIIPKEYYFLSSKGVVQKDFTYRDVDADKWRKAVGNFFEDKKDCQAYRQRIIDSFNK